MNGINRYGYDSIDFPETIKFFQLFLNVAIAELNREVWYGDEYRIKKSKEKVKDHEDILRGEIADYEAQVAVNDWSE